MSVVNCNNSAGSPVIIDFGYYEDKEPFNINEYSDFDIYNEIILVNCRNYVVINKSTMKSLIFIDKNSYIMITNNITINNENDNMIIRCTDNTITFYESIDALGIMSINKSICCKGGINNSFIRTNRYVDSITTNCYYTNNIHNDYNNEVFRNILKDYNYTEFDIMFDDKCYDYSRFFNATYNIFVDKEVDININGQFTGIINIKTNNDESEQNKNISEEYINKLIEKYGNENIHRQ